MDTASYRELAPTAFKLLEVLDPEQGIPQCRVLETTLEHCPSFAALSYVWGPESPTRTIWLDGQQVCVRQNLWDFLVDAARRRPWNMSEPDFIESRYLWVDALCIDQDDAHQKSHQVKLMGQIFSKADVVIVWLGKRDEECDCGAALSGLSWLANRRRNEITPILGLDGHVFIDWDEEDVAWILKNGSSLLALLDHKYFSRAWIVQEIMLATRIMVISGDQAASWSIIDAFARTLANRQTRDQVADKPLMTQLAASRGCSIIRARQTWWSRPSQRKSDEGPPLELLIVAFRFTQCTLLHDKVYALLPLAGIGAGDDDLREVPVDYTKTVEEVYHDVLRYFYSRRSFQAASSIDQQKLIRILQEVLVLDPHNSEINRVTRIFAPEFDATIEGIPEFYRKAENDANHANAFIAMMEQHNDLQQQTMLENMEIEKARAFWDPVESMSKRDATS